LSMAKSRTVTRRRSKEPRRQATRKLQSVPSEAARAPVPVQGEIDEPLDLDLAVDPAELIGRLARRAIAMIDESRTPLAAEMALADLLGMAEQSLEPGDHEFAAQTLAEMLAGLVLWAGREGTSGALALLRVIEVLGPLQVREMASEAAARLSASGLKDRPWAARIGRPRLLRAWRYGDVSGEQDSVFVTFDYMSREHVVSVLIDHGLGGGVKDALVAEGRALSRLRNDTAAEMASNPLAEFEDLTLPAAAVRLAAALAEDPCPVADDQIEDVARFLPLIRARLRLMAAELELSLPEPVLPEVVGSLGDAETILRLKVSLQGTTPPIWRRLEIPADLTLDGLHAVLQMAFGWTNSHLHAFEQVSAGPRRVFGSQEIATEKEPRTRLSSLVTEPGDRLMYRYDFGDDWEHLITVEAAEPADDDITYPRCTGGRRNGPPEDCGGAPGYAHLLQVLAGPPDEEYSELLEWLGKGFDPAAFDKDAVSSSLTPL
jgi:hypothetical protein